MLPAAHTPEEKELKLLFERIKNDRKIFEAALKKAGCTVGKLEQRQSKDSVDDADLNREEVLKKLASGKITLEKNDGVKQTFKRHKIARKESNPQHNSLDFGRIGASSSTISSFQMPPINREVNKGPTLYIRGYNLKEDALNNSFAKFGQIKRCHVEEKQRSAFLTLSNVEEAETAIREMKGKVVDGSSIQVSFARRQNQDIRPQQPWTQTFVSAGFTPSTVVNNEEVQPLKRKLSDPNPGVDEKKREPVKYEDGELFDDVHIQ